MIENELQHAVTQAALGNLRSGLTHLKNNKPKYGLWYETEINALCSQIETLEAEIKEYEGNRQLKDD